MVDCDGKVDRGFYTNIKGPELEGDIQADFTDIRKLQIFSDKIRKLVQILQLNIDLGVQVKSSMQRIRGASAETLSPAFDELDSKLDLFLFQHRTHLSRVQLLISRSQGISSLVSDLNNFRAKTRLMAIATDSKYFGYSRYREQHENEHFNTGVDRAKYTGK